MRLIDADELERRIREAETSFYDSEDVGIAIDCIDSTKTIDGWNYPSRGEYPPKEQEYLVAFKANHEVYYDVRELNPTLNNLWLGIGERIIAWKYIEIPQEEA